jgi:hypothetical protein
MGKQNLFWDKFFNYIYAAFKNVSLEEDESPKAKSLLIFILRYYININVRTSTQTHVIHGTGPVWYKDVIPAKTLYFNFHESRIIGATVFIASLSITLMRITLLQLLQLALINECQHPTPHPPIKQNL